MVQVRPNALAHTIDARVYQPLCGHRWAPPPKRMRGDKMIAWGSNPRHTFGPHLSWTTLVTRVGFEVGEYFLCLGADFGGGDDLLAADLDGDVSQGT